MKWILQGEHNTVMIAKHLNQTFIGVWEYGVN